jgi:hypothetical protein
VPGGRGRRTDLVRDRSRHRRGYCCPDNQKVLRAFRRQG